MLLIVQCTINLVIATIGKLISDSYKIGEFFFGGKKYTFSIQIPKKELLGREVMIINRGKE